MIVIAAPPVLSSTRNAFLHTLRGALLDETDSTVLVIPHLYFLTPDHPAMASMKAKDVRKIVLAAWLRPRAIVWTARALGIPNDTEIVPIRIVEDTGISDTTAQILNAADDAAHAPESIPDPLSSTPESLPERWYPVLDYDRCRHCGQCLEFCLFGVYTRTDDGKIRVSCPDKCKPGCPACARLCPYGAILFPHCQTDDMIAGADISLQSVGTIDQARAFAKDHLARYTERPTPSHKADTRFPELDKLIDDLEKLDAESE